jgi:hypothetical protein
MNSSTFFIVAILIAIGMLAYTMLNIRQLGHFTDHIERAIDDEHHKRMALIRENEDPSIVPDLDVQASYKMLDKSWAWDYDFDRMIVYKK